MEPAWDLFRSIFVPTWLVSARKCRLLSKRSGARFFAHKNCSCCCCCYYSSQNLQAEKSKARPGDGFSRDNVIGVLSVASHIGDFFRTSVCTLTAQFFFRKSCAGHDRVNIIYVVIVIVLMQFHGKIWPLWWWTRGFTLQAIRVTRVFIKNLNIIDLDQGIYR